MAELRPSLRIDVVQCGATGVRLQVTGEVDLTAGTYLHANPLYGDFPGFEEGILYMDLGKVCSTDTVSAESAHDSPVLTTVILDLTRVTFIDATGFYCLLTPLLQAGLRVIIEPSPQFRKIMEIAHIEREHLPRPTGES